MKELTDQADLMLSLSACRRSLHIAAVAVTRILNLDSGFITFLFLIA